MKKLAVVLLLAMAAAGSAVAEDPQTRRLVFSGENELEIGRASCRERVSSPV